MKIMKKMKILKRSLKSLKRVKKISKDFKRVQGVPKDLRAFSKGLQKICKILQGFASDYKDFIE